MKSSTEQAQDVASPTVDEKTIDLGEATFTDDAPALPGQEVVMSGRDFTNMFAAFSALALGMALNASTAEAACPAAYSGSACNTSSGGMNVCDRVGNVWICDLLRTGGSQRGTGYAVWDAANSEYSAWGVAGNGQTFCCSLSNITGLEEVALSGTQQPDTLSFYDPTSGLQMDAYSTTLLKTRLYGQRGDDTMRGSDSIDVAYMETLYGDKGYDVMEGGLGNDVLYGGIGNDTMDGGDGDDFMMGDEGADFMVGGNDNDIINGGDGPDDINGDAGTDHLIGENNTDLLCGGGYSATPDAFDGGDGGDEICGQAGGQETGNAGLGTNRCWDSGSILVSLCTTSLTETWCNTYCP